MPEAQRRFTVSPGTDTGSPASSTAIRATFRLSSPAWFAQPRITSVIRSGSSEGWRATSAAMTCAAMSSARTSLSCPPMLPTAVRMPSRMYASVMRLIEVMLLRRPVHGGVHERDAGAVLPGDGHPIEADARPGRFLLRHRDELVDHLHRDRIGDGVVHAHGHVAIGVRRERQRAVGER